MRIVLLTTAAGSGGVSRHLLDLAFSLRGRGHEPCLAVPPEARFVPDARERGLRVIPIRDAAREPADIWHLHLHYTYERESLLVTLKRRPQGAASVLTEHLPRSNSSDDTLLPGPRRQGAKPLKTLFKRVQAGRVQRVIVLSDGSRRFLQERYGLTDRVLRRVPNGIDLVGTTPPPPPPSAGTLRVLSIGALGVQKGHDMLIAAAGLAKEDWSATIVGEGSGRELLERQAAAVGRGRVAFTGWRDDVPELLAACDCVCLPSRWESCPYAALEAMAAGRAVVASAVDGLDELVEHGRTGFLVAPGDPLALAEALDALARDRSVGREFGVAGRARVLEVGSLDRMIDGTIAVYRELVDG